ncbi:hypothetical protein [Labilibaculum sp.]|uniref:hypothetical protein n=1 Tax=Labilibaculum sp. TaxID=2060723 RepID=UPI00356AEDA0
MNKILSLLLICLSSFPLFSQEHLPSAPDYQHFYQTKTLVVLEDNIMCEYNDKIKEAIDQKWKLTDYEFISNEEFRKKKSDSNYSFLVRSIVHFNKDKTKASYNFLSLLLGGQATDISDMPDLCSIPLSYEGVNEDGFTYKLSSLVQFIQNHIDLVHENPNIISENVLRYYNKNNTETKGKTLYLLASELDSDVNTISKIRKVYPAKVKLVGPDEIENAIRNKKEDVIFLHKVGPEKTKNKARCFKILIGAADAKFYYFDYHMVKGKQTDRFLESDFKKLAR